METVLVDFARYLPAALVGKRPVVPVVRLQGPIGAFGAGRGALTASGLDASLDKAFGIKGAVAVALAINSPGGAPVQSNLIFRRVRQLAEEKKLPVYAYVEDVAASGGYMLACAGDEIIVDPASIVGSIGVISASFGFDKAIERLGVERRVHTAGARKSTLDPFMPEVPADVEHLMALQKEIHDSFVALVRGRRGDRLKESDDLYSGLFWVGRTAIDLGLADRVGTLHEDLRAKFGDKVDIRPVARGGGFLRRQIFGSYGETRTPALLSAEDALAAVEARSHYWRYGL